MLKKSITIALTLSVLALSTASTSAETMLYGSQPSLETNHLPFSKDGWTVLASTKEQGVSTRIKQLVENSHNNCDFVDVPYCYKFKAIVNIDSGYLRVWKSDSKGNAYVVGELKKGEVIYVRDIFKYRGKEFALITHLTQDCMSTGCQGRVDLRYLK